jgi:hydrogenase large subunit
MPTTIKVDPVTRIEGHLNIEVTVESVNGQQQAVDARCSGTMFRGFENMLLGRDPRDAVHYTQRICGVCPVAHGLAAAMNLESAFGIRPPDNGRILRNLILGSNYIQSHVLHFYHLAALDYINTSGILDMSPWTPRYVTPDMVSGSVAEAFVNHYVAALHVRRRAHRMGAVFGGKLPCTPTIVAGGVTEAVTAAKIAEFRTVLTEIRGFIDNVFVPDLQTLAGAFSDYYSVGTGCGNLLAYGVFDLDSSGQNKLLSRGRYTDGVPAETNAADIGEYVKYSWYSGSSGGLNPSDGVTDPVAGKMGAYSWIKAPRYQGKVHELGPLARMWINGDYTNGISVMDRLMARALETKKVADAMDGWLNELVPGAPVCQAYSKPAEASGIGLTEAARGALGHWIDISGGTISRYQVVTPTSWNASPRDDSDLPGPIEHALIGTVVADPDQPVELLRIVHSFDPCLACSVHMVSPKNRQGKAVLARQ